ncbi:LysR family transcriptional regulator [Paraburkholderia sp. HD33-4]|uniref:LysR family transcriptional regulator n=1 Tax=Paraburkholderia sp. HD33-4 TaxID=2883242 RepID=UPI001F3829A0|nr:LysR family transcriptional regulator [Paraburkholderia sp. HD33-4]
MKEDLNDLVAFLAVARERNFTRAAAQIGVSQSALSRTVRGLEERMGLPLLMRTTRSVSLTDAGERLVSAIEPRLEEIEAELDSLRAMTDRPAGTVRITATDYAGNTYVWPRVQGLLRAYPELRIELVTDYGLSDIVADRYDIGVRLGDQVAQGMIAARIAPDMTMAIVGSPAYLKSRSATRTPHDLTLHNCINLRLPTRNSLLPWELSNGKRQLQVRVDGQLTFSNVYQMVDAALGGFGLVYVPKDLVESYVKSGRLEWVLEEWFPTFVGYHVYYPSRRKSSRAVGLVVNALKSG